jgi:toluene monooxygenase system ferredoxin subunit
MSEDGPLNWIRACTLDELWEGDFLDTKIEGEEVILIHMVGGEIRCFQGMCPHQAILLADGDVDFESGIITCSAHEWQFDMDSGKGKNPTGCKLFRYEVKLEGDDVLVGVPTDGRLRRLRHEAEEET